MAVPRNSSELLSYISDHKNLTDWFLFALTLPITVFVLLYAYLAFFLHISDGAAKIFGNGDPLMFSGLLLVGALLELKDTDRICTSVNRDSGVGTWSSVVLLVLCLMLIIYGLNVGTIAELENGGLVFQEKLRHRMRLWAIIGVMGIISGTVLSCASILRSHRALKIGGIDDI